MSMCFNFCYCRHFYNHCMHGCCWCKQSILSYAFNSHKCNASVSLHGHFWYLAFIVSDSVIITIICQHFVSSIHINWHLAWLHTSDFVVDQGAWSFSAISTVWLGRTRPREKEKKGQTSSDSPSSSLHAPNPLLSSTCHTLAAKRNWLLISFLPQVSCDGRL